MNLQNASGVISNLQVVHTKQSILYGPQIKEASRISALVFALAGMSGAAVQTSLNSDGGAEDVDMYSFDIKGVRYAGCTRGISLNNGDEVELVYEARTEGREAIAVRRPGTRSIWIYPYMSRGVVAGVLSTLRLWVLFTIGCDSLTLLIGWAVGISLHSAFYLVVASFIVVFLSVSWMLPRLFRFARAADEVFAAFDYPNPKMVDLHKTSRAYRKAHGITWSAKNNFELWY